MERDLPIAERVYKLHTLRSQGVTPKQMALKYGVSTQAVYDFFSNHKTNIHVKKYGWAHKIKVRQATPRIYPTLLTPIESLKVDHIKFTGRDYTRELVRLRDNRTCQDCGKIWVEGTRRLDIHHLSGLCGKKSKGYDSVKDSSNLISLCHKCHFNHPQHTLKSR